MKRALPFLPIPVAVIALALWRPGLLVGGLQSGKGFAVMAGVGVAGIVTLALFWRRSAQVAAALASVVVLALMAATLWPALRERTVVEAFPSVATPALAAAAAPTRLPVVAQASALRLKSGRFGGIHHRASGTASLYDISGRTALRLEDISFQGTPGPSVHLVKKGARSPKGGIGLGALKAEHGSFSYKAPVGFNAGGGWTVLVWCDTYDVPIAAADLS